MRKLLTLTVASLILVSCNSGETTQAEKITPVAATVAADDVAKFDGAKLAEILKAQPEAAQARYGARRPAETLKFFDIKPGMRVGEALPGGGWYTKILVPYLGQDGQLTGIDYSLEMWPEFSFANEAFIENKKKWPEEFIAKAAEWAPTDGPKITATTFGLDAGEHAGRLDAVLFIRAMHNLSRFESEGEYMTKALAKTRELLKPGGIVGVVQHRAPEDADDAWASGNAGYLKQSAVIAAFKAAGFDLVKTSELNANPKDQPTADDIVWRLPPSLNGVGDNDALKAERLAIGESDRMTLLFKKR
jgi:predicted methyltransferase